jgi:hypothetical protein
MRVIAVTTTILGSITFLSVAWPYLLPIIQNRNIWAAISLIAILLFTSGHMFNHIRKVPYVAGDGRGGISYFAGGFSNQFGLETQIVAAMCKFMTSRWNALSADTTRWTPVIRYHFIGTKGAAYIGSKDSTTRGNCLGGCDLRHVQLSTECFPNQERWLSILAASLLVKVYVMAGNGERERATGKGACTIRGYIDKMSCEYLEQMLDLSL